MRWPWVIGGATIAVPFLYYVLRPRPLKSLLSTPFSPPFALIGDSIGVGMAPHLGLPQLTSFAIVGASTARMSDVADAELAPGRFSTVIVEGHLNDMARDENFSKQNLSEVYRRARSSGARVIGVTSTEWSGYALHNPTRAYQRELVNEWILRGADGLLDHSVDLRNVQAEHAPDRLHFTQSGYRTLAERVRSAII